MDPMLEDFLCQWFILMFIAGGVLILVALVSTIVSKRNQPKIRVSQTKPQVHPKTKFDAEVDEALSLINGK